MISHATHSTQLHETKFDYIPFRMTLWSTIKEMDRHNGIWHVAILLNAGGV